MKAAAGLVARWSLFWCLLLGCVSAWSQSKSDSSWSFAVSGDSRNCGDVVMPAIAGDALKHNIEFYWHLGDFRKMSGVDEDMTVRFGNQVSLDDYRRDAWGDFTAHQVAPFGLIPVYLGIGNHELYGKTRNDFVNQFAYWLDAPELRHQRAADPVKSDLLTYFHWVRKHVDFIYLDNADDTGFSEAQLKWLEGVLAKDKDDPEVLTVVAGMHRALPNSLACGHSMNGDVETPADVAAKTLGSGRRAYHDLLDWKKQTGKRVYVLASHSHFFMERIFETPYWQHAGAADRGVLPGWIVGTAGAQRYSLPDGLPKGIHAETFVSGYLLGTVAANGEIQFEFKKVKEGDVPKITREEFGDAFIKTCFTDNKSPGLRLAPASCSEK